MPAPAATSDVVADVDAMADAVEKLHTLASGAAGAHAREEAQAACAAAVARAACALSLIHI